MIIASVNGLEAGQYTAHYVAAKHGVIGLMKNIALELAPYGVRCNAISPGAINTPMTSHQGALDMFAGHPGGTEDDMIEAGHHYTLLKGASCPEPPGHRRLRALPQLRSRREGNRRDHSGRRGPHDPLRL